MEWKELIAQIEQYVENSAQCPLKFYYEIATKINKRYQALALAHIGGEGLVIKALDETGEKICLKIARQDAQLPATDKKVSVFKILNFQRSQNINVYAERFKEGAIIQRRLCSALKSERIHFFSVPEIHTISSEPFLYIQMEWIDSPCVLRFLQEKNNIEYSMTLFIELLRAVEYCHGRGIVHRDLKSDNILIGEKDTVVLLDWTLSKEIGDRGLTIPGTVGGTIGYAPSKFVHDGDFGQANYRDDIYSLGFVFWEFCTQKKVPLLKRSDYTDKKIELYRKTLLTYLPDFAQRIFWTATNQKEKERYQSIKPFAADVANFISYLKENSAKVDSISIPDEFDSKEVQTIDEIIDTKIYIENLQFCERCAPKAICAQFQICKKFLIALQDLKKKGII